MLPSCGHFKNILCPFFKVGLCVRPQCHYKHTKSDDASEQQSFPSVIDEAECLFDTDPKVNYLLSKSSYQTEIAIESQENATYIPTPVDKCIKPVGILKSNNSNLDRPSTSCIPEYKPTPISKLKELNIANSNFSQEYSPDYTSTTRKKKKIEEYDPTEVKCVPRKSVSFADQSSLSSTFSPPEISLISSDEEFDDSASAPKFSDDDLDDDEPVVQLSNNKNVSVNIRNNDEKEESFEEEKIDEFSLVDKILVDCKKNEKFLNSYRKPILPPKQSKPSTKEHSQPKDVEKNVTSSHKVKENSDKKAESDVFILNLEAEIIEAKKSLELKQTSSQRKELSCTKEKKSASKCHTSDSKKGLDSDVISDTKAKKSSDGKKEKERKEDVKNKVDKHKIKSAKSVSSDSSTKKEKSSKSSTEKSKNNKSNNQECKKSNSKDIKNSKLERTKDSSVPSDKKNLKKGHSSSGKQEVKLQDGKVSSSSISKKTKQEQAVHHKSSNFDITKSKNIQKETSNKLSLNGKRKHTNDTGSKSYEEKHSSVSNSKQNSVSPSKKVKTDDHVNSMDEEEEKFYNVGSSSDSDLDEECWRIYNEKFPESSDSLDKEVCSKKTSHISEDLKILRKKRFAHPGAVDFKKPSSFEKKSEIKKTLNPAQVLHNRYAQLQAMYARQNEQKLDAGNSLPRNNDKKRISIAVNPGLLAAVTQKNLLSQNASAGSDFSPLPSTVSRTYKTNKRVAHVPDAALKPRPIIPSEYGSKVPANVRQKFLNAFIDECLKFCLAEEEAYECALDEEKKAYERSSCKALYMNVAANTLKRLRNRAEAGPEIIGGPKSDVVSVTNPSTKSSSKTVSHETMLNGPQAQRTSFSIGRKKQTPEIKGGAELYEYLLNYVLTPEQLKENGFPLPHPTIKDKAIIEGVYANRAHYCNDPFKRTCCRCQKVYYVNVDGEYVRDEECDFHWGRLWKRRIAGAIESRYSCCQGDSESDGCCVSAGHVFEGSEAHALKGFVSTLPKTPPPDKCYGIYALDCEMCYTTAGMELTRVTVIGTDLKPVYESFVKPQHTVLDYNTRFSGITEDDLKNVRTTLHDVQAVLLCIFNDKTILIGHSLESDFKALKLFHKTVVDTSVVFPHRNGLPFKRALKTLMAEKLNKIIQNEVGGHDSQEDAAACMELMLWKVKEDVKSNR